MTTRTKELIACECGHEGYLHCSENDAPFSSMYESYRLEGFQGGTLRITSIPDMPEDLIGALNPVCPECGQANKVAYAHRS